MHTCDYDSPLGKMLLAADDDGLTGAWFYGQRYFARGLEDAEKNERRGVPFDSPVLLAARRWLDAYFAGERPDAADVPLAPRGTAFQRRVWDALLAIPYGEACTYGALAAVLGSSPRAVGAAVGRNWVRTAPSPATPAASSVSERCWSWRRRVPNNVRVAVTLEPRIDQNPHLREERAGCGRFGREERPQPASIPQGADNATARGWR